MFSFVLLSYNLIIFQEINSKVDQATEAGEDFYKLYYETADKKRHVCVYNFWYIMPNSAKHAVLRRKSKDWLARNPDNVSEWGDMSIHELLFQWASTIKIQLSILV